MKLHALGDYDYLKSIEEKYHTSRKEVIENDKLTESERNAELKKLREIFEDEKRFSEKNLY